MFCLLSYGKISWFWPPIRLSMEIDLAFKECKSWYVEGSVGVVNIRDCRTHLFLVYQRAADDIKPNIRDYGGASTFHGSFLLIFSTEISPPPPSLLPPFLSAVNFVCGGQNLHLSQARPEKCYKLKKIISWCMASYFLPAVRVRQNYYSLWGEISQYFLLYSSLTYFPPWNIYWASCRERDMSKVSVVVNEWY